MTTPQSDPSDSEEFVELTGRKQEWSADELRARIRSDFANPEFQRSTIAGMVESFEKVLKEGSTD